MINGMKDLRINCVRLNTQIYSHIGIGSHFSIIHIRAYTINTIQILYYDYINTLTLFIFILDCN